MHTDFVLKVKRKKPLDAPRYTLEGNIKIDVGKENGGGYVLHSSGCDELIADCHEEQQILE
jgi:hypothetical protein